MATKIKAFLVQGDATEKIDVHITRVIDAWLKDNGDKVSGTPVVATDNSFTKALVLLTYEEEAKSVVKK